MTGAITVSAPAKVNLFLRVLHREAGGFHAIETLFCRLDLADDLTAAVSAEPGVRISVSGADTGPVERNLAVRAATMVLEATGNRFGVELDLVKRIPVAAGLGGGSSDAAAALTAVNALAGNPVPRHELLQFGARLGADIPFLLSGAPLALAWGRGDRLLALPPLPSAPVLLLIPQVPVSTADAYGWVDAARGLQGSSGRGGLALDLEALSGWGSIGRMAGNDFEAPVFGRHPQIRTAFEALAATRPLLCRMSGSGSTLFAVYRTAADRDEACQQLGRRHGALVPATSA